MLEVLSQLIGLSSGGELERIRNYLELSRSSNTWKAYRSDIRDYLDWCDDREFDGFPCSPAQLCMYADSLEIRDLKMSTIRRRVAALAAAHRAHDLDPPSTSDAWRQFWRGMKRVKGTRQDHSRPMWFSDLCQIVRYIRRDRLIDFRDRSIILLGWAAGMRRSEIAGLDFDDISWRDLGVSVLIRRSKTDQEGEGRLVPVFRGRDKSVCPVTAIDRWIEASGIGDGPLYRQVGREKFVQDERLLGASINRIVKARAARAGLSQDLSAHSLRSGFASSARAGGASEASIMRITGHKSLSGLSPYLTEGELFSENPASKAGL